MLAGSSIQVRNPSRNHKVGTTTKVRPLALGSPQLDKTILVHLNNTKTHPVSTRESPLRLQALLTTTQYAASARYNPQFLAQMQNADLSPEQYYPHSPIDQPSVPRNGKSPMTLRQQRPSFPRTPGAGPVPKFQKVKSAQELQPRINSQPPFRRANPEGGFISVRVIWSHSYGLSLTS
jgi:hypothetical protein